MMLLTVTTTLDRALYYMAPRYRLDRTIVPDTKDRFTNNLPVPLHGERDTASPRGRYGERPQRDSV